MNSLQKKKKILVPIFYRAHLGRLQSVLHAIATHQDLELQIMVAVPGAYGSFWRHLWHSAPQRWNAALPWYIRARMRGMFKGASADPLVRKVREEGFTVQSEIPLFFDGGTPATMAKSVGFGMVRIIDEMQRLKPDMVFVNADRFEMMAVTLAAAYCNIPIAHNEAGDVSGTIDESVRHAITKFAHVHLTATEVSRKRVIQMGENPDFVFMVGSPVIDVLKELDMTTPIVSIGGFDTSRQYLVAMVHPITTENNQENLRMVQSVLAALEELKMPTVIIGGNSDAQSQVSGPTIAKWLEEKKHPWVKAFKWVHSAHYFQLLARAACAVGNSSSFIREAGYLGIPAVIVGSRQQGREYGENVLEVAADGGAIRRAVQKQIAHGRYPRSTLFGDGGTGKKIAEILATADPSIQKKFYEI